jgi:hypothetical protein
MDIVSNWTDSLKGSDYPLEGLELMYVQYSQ